MKKIYTKKGDKGYTYLMNGQKVKKNNKILNAYGTVDELISFCGLLFSLIKEKKIKNQLLYIINRLMNISCELADTNNRVKDISYISMNDVKNIESYIDNLSKNLTDITEFTLPLGNLKISYCHICRTICRRTEREVIDVVIELNKNYHILSFLNRLSDYFFILARYIAHKDKIKEIKWNKNL